jgi:hypothetical protein
MFGAFDDPLFYTADGRWLDACGPLAWDDDSQGPQNAQRVTVAATVSQNGVVGQGMGTFVNGADDEWMIAVRPPQGGKFVAGAAQARGVLTVTDPPTLETWPWQMTVQLQPR